MTSDRPGDGGSRGDGGGDVGGDGGSDGDAATAVRLGTQLTPMQRGLLASQRRHPAAPHQNMALVSHLDGPIDPAVLDRAFAAVVARHDALRTRIDDVDGAAVARVSPATPESLPHTDVIELDRADVASWAAARASVPIDLSVGPADSVLLRHADGTSSWYLAFHHVAIDATSSAKVFAAVGEVYHAMLVGDQVPAAAEPASYYQWYRRQSRREPSARSAKVDRFWATRPEAPRIGRLYEAVSSPTPLSKRVEVDPGSRLAAAEQLLAGDLRMLSTELGWTTLMMATAALYLHRLTGADRFAIGMPVHNRSTAEARNVIGPVMDVFGVDIVIEPDDTARTLHKRVGRSILTTLRNAEVGRSAPGDFETVVNVIPTMGYGDFGPIPATTTWVHSGATDPSHLLRVQLTGYGTRHADPSADESRGAGEAGESWGAAEAAGPQLQLALDLNEAAVLPEHAEAAPHHFLAALDTFLGDLEASLGERSLITPDEAVRIMEWGSGPAAPDPRGPVIEQLRSAVGSRTDTVIEAADGSEALTGVELWRRVDQRAAQLAANGVKAGDRVAIERGRSVGTVVDIYAVMTLGASYVPLDPAQPRARLDSLIERAETVLTLTTDSLPADPVAGNAGPDASGGGFHRPAIDPNDEAYLLFTSGSTGEPKGVPITQWGLAGYIDFARTSYFESASLEAAPVAALFTALTFDLTVTTLFAPLLAGGRLVVIDADGPAAVRAIADRADITWAKATPSHLDLLLRWIPEEHSLRTLVVGGEAFTTRLARRLWDWRSDLVLFNEYGPTEAVVGCMIHLADQARLSADPAQLGVGAARPLADVPIGVPAPGVRLAVLDRYQQPVPIGAVGELYISHAGITSGYLADRTNQGENSADDPFIEMGGRRWYRSGDLVRLVGDPLTLVYLGRADEQVKIGGIRLDPSEVEQALGSHPAISVAAVRVWSPVDAVAATDVRYCVRCGLSSRVPGTVFDDDGVCAVCHSYDRVKVQAASYFGTLDDLVEIRDQARAQRTGRYDAVHLLSGGKDSTYALYRLVELGFEVLALTLDNGFISEGAKDNARRSAADLGIDHEFMTTPAMNEIFRDSLERFSNVCNGCYKAIYTLATNRAVAEGAPLIFTGLSRGQLFETRLIPQQFTGDRFDPEAIDRAVVEARRAYHRTDDVPNRLLDTAIFREGSFQEGTFQEETVQEGADGDGPDRGGDLFDRLRYVDFYRYIDVELAEMLDFLDHSAPWVRPSDTGRSTNCLINAAGIHSHLIEQGYHNYAEPYAWDVRLGHKTRDEALEELDDRDDLDSVLSMLAEIDYQPQPRQVLTGWVEVADGATMPEPAELRQHLAQLLPTHAIPAAYVAVDRLPTTTNGKLDTAALPAPERVHRPGPALHVEATSDLEKLIVERWERQLKIEPISATDDFFDLGGDSLMALEMIVALGERLDLVLPEEMAFANTTPRLLAAAIEVATNTASVENAHESLDHPTPRAAGIEPPFSAGELALLFQHLDAPDDPRYNICRLYELDESTLGPKSSEAARFDAASLDAARFDTARFVEALRTVVERHVPLHWSFGFPRRRLTLEEALDLTVEPSPADADSVRFEAVALQSRPFDLEHGPLARCRIQPLADPSGAPSGVVSIALVFHHISIDATSFDLLWSELDAAYRGEALPDLTVDYADVAAWHATHSNDAAQAHWRSVNDGQPLPQPSWQSSWPAAPVGHPSGSDAETGPTDAGAAGSEAAAAVAGYLDRPLGITRSMLAGHDGATPFVTVLATIATVVGDHVPGDRVALGMVGTTRDHPASRPLIGYFINPLPIVLDLSPADDRIHRTADAVRTALAHRAYPYSAMVADRRRNGLDPLELGVLVALQETAPIRLGEAMLTQQIIGTGSSVAPVTFFLQLEGEAVTLAVEYQAGTLSPAVADRLLASIEDHLVANIGATPSGAAPAGVVSPGSALDRSKGATLHQLVLDAAAAAPNEPAVIAGGDTLAYGELRAQVERLAAHLQARGVGSGDVVGVDASRRPLFAVAALAVMATGAAYAPLDPALPSRRLATIIDDASIRLVIVTGSDLQTGSVWPDAEVIDAAAVVAGSVEGHSALEPVDVDPASVAYVLYTSGSTGTPKGVMVSHANIVATTLARTEFYPEPVDRFLVLSSFAFDSSAAGLYWALTQGGAVVLPDDGLHTEVTHLADLIEQHRVTQLLALPSLYRLLLTENDTARLATLRDAIVAGEACPASLVELHTELLPAARLTNEFGPTEAAVWSHAHTFDPATAPVDDVPIGRPIPGATDRVVDDELWIGGDGVALGYLGRPDLTSERFVERDGRRWYRTGDRVGVLDDGSLTFLGRVDHQVKLRGHRIEIGEIERVIESHPAVLRAVSAVVEPPERPSAMIAVWYETSRGVSSDELRSHAAALLPEVMQPGRYIEVESLPLNVNGKIDRSALTLDPPPATAAADTSGTADEAAPDDHVLPDDIVAAMLDHDPSPLDQLARLWAEALGVEQVGLDDNYFDLGGDSIISIQIVARARRLGLDLKPRDVFEHQTVRALAAHLASVAPSAPADEPPTALDSTVPNSTVPNSTVLDSTVLDSTVLDPGLASNGHSFDPGSPPLLPIQHWLLDQQLPHLDHWAQYRWLELADDVDLVRLEAAATTLPATHPALRHRFHRSSDGWSITTVDAATPSSELIGIERHDLGDTASPNWRAFADELAGRIDLADGPTIRLATFTSGSRRRCVIVAHHLVVDGVSWGVLLDDWAEAYRSNATAPPAGDVGDWARLVASPLAMQAVQASYPLWHEMLPATPPNTTTVTEGDGRAVRRALSVEHTAMLRRSGYPSAILSALAVAGRAVLGWAALEAIVEGHGREAEALAPGAALDLSRTVGWCTTHHAVSVPLDPSADVAALRRAVGETLARIPDRGVGFGIGRYLDPTSGLGYRPLPSVVFGFLGRVDASTTLSDVFAHAEPMTTSIHPDNPRFHDLGILAFIEDGALHVEVDGTCHHSDADLQALADAIMADLIGQAEEAPLPASAISPSLVGKRELVSLSSTALRRVSQLLDRSNQPKHS